MGGGGVDGAIHKAAGPGLYEECLSLGGCEPGNAKITNGHNLPARHIIHAVGPVGEQPLVLANCYQRSLEILLENGLRTICFCCISTGAYGYPCEKAAQVALTTVRDWLLEKENNRRVDRIVFCTFLDKDKEIYETLGPKVFCQRPKSGGSFFEDRGEQF